MKFFGLMKGNYFFILIEDHSILAIYMYLLSYLLCILINNQDHHQSSKLKLNQKKFLLETFYFVIFL